MNDQVVILNQSFLKNFTRMEFELILRGMLLNFLSHGFFEGACMELAQNTRRITHSVRKMIIGRFKPTFATKKTLIWAI